MPATYVIPQLRGTIPAGDYFLERREYSNDIDTCQWRSREKVLDYLEDFGGLTPTYFKLENRKYFFNLPANPNPDAPFTGWGISLGQNFDSFGSSDLGHGNDNGQVWRYLGERFATNHVIVGSQPAESQPSPFSCLGRNVFTPWFGNYGVTFSLKIEPWYA